MATTKTDAQRVEEYRKQAMDKSLPQEVRDMADEKAKAIEAKAAGKAGVKLAKGGAVVAKAPVKKAMAKGGAVAKKAPTKLAKGGMAKKKC